MVFLEAASGAQHRRASPVLKISAVYAILRFPVLLLFPVLEALVVALDFPGWTVVVVVVAS